MEIPEYFMYIMDYINLVSKKQRIYKQYTGSPPSWHQNKTSQVFN